VASSVCQSLLNNAKTAEPIEIYRWGYIHVEPRNHSRGTYESHLANKIERTVLRGNRGCSYQYRSNLLILVLGRIAGTRCVDAVYCTDVARSVVCLSVCLSVCILDSRVGCAITAFVLKHSGRFVIKLSLKILLCIIRCVATRYTILSLYTDSPNVRKSQITIY